MEGCEEANVNSLFTQKDVSTLGRGDDARMCGRGGFSSRSSASLLRRGGESKFKYEVEWSVTSLCVILCLLPLPR